MHLMKRPIRPTTALGWWAFCLGITSVGWGVLLPTLPESLIAIGIATEGGPFPIPVGFSGLILELIVAISALTVGVLAVRRGERSWLTLAGFVPAIVIGGFWILFALGEVLVPH